MNITNKKLAFYIATITVALATVAQSFNILTADQASTVMAAIGMICAAFGLSDVGFDYLNIARRNYTVSETSETTVSDNAPSLPVESTKTTTTFSAPVFTENPDNVSVAG